MGVVYACGDDGLPADGPHHGAEEIVAAGDVNKTVRGDKAKAVLRRVALGGSAGVAA